MERLLELKKLLRIEREDDLRQYEEVFTKGNIQYRKQKGVTWFPVSIINSEIGLGEYLIIEVERTSNQDESHQFSNGKNITIFSNQYPDEKPLAGTIKLSQKNKLKISLTVDELPDWCSDGKLGVNLSFDDVSYKEMESALEKVIQASGNRLAHLRDVIYKVIPPQFKKLKEDHSSTDLNPSQNEAVNKIISAEDVALVHGPPGTGKTTTLVHAITEVLKTEKQVLVCSPSNTAVDLLTEKLHRKGIDVLRVGNPVRVSADVMNNTVDVRVASHEASKELKNFRKRAEEFFRMAGKYKRILGREEREQRQLLYREAKKIIKEARELEDYILDDLLEKAQVIACTPVVSAGKILRNRNFTTLFIDEAAQALEPMCWIPILKSHRVILAGDHFQLPPTVKSKRAGGLMSTLFEQCMSVENISVMLNIQYRMNEKIMQFSNSKFYHNDLHAHSTVASHVLNASSDDRLLNTPLTFIDTAGCSYEEKLNPESVSTSNPDEAALLFRHLKMLL
ncbi:MAG: AAA domain-containing protein, partial [Bacteroidota bacterium]